MKMATMGLIGNSTKTDRAFRALLVALVFLLCVAVPLVVAMGAYQVQLIQKTAQIAALNRVSNKLLVECNTPPELRNPPVKVAPGDSADCYNRTQSIAGNAVESIRVISIAAAACGAAHPGDADATEVCVNEALADTRTAKP